MSWDALAWAWKQDKVTASEKLVLMALAYMENDETRVCKPSMNHLATKCRLTDRRCRDILKGLEERGFLSIQRRRKSAREWTSNLYFLAWRVWSAEAIGEVLGTETTSVPYGNHFSTPTETTSVPPTEISRHTKINSLKNKQRKEKGEDSAAAAAKVPQELTAIERLKNRFA